MADTLAIKQLYDSTFPTEERLNEFSRHLKLTESFTKITFLETTNTAFAILGHFADLDTSTLFDVSDISHKYKPNISTPSLINFAYALQKIKVLNADFSWNPTAVPMIQRYDKIFAAYEKQNGITDPFALRRK